MRGKTVNKCSAAFAGIVIVVLIGAGCAMAQPVIAAYQKIYAMNFEVWRPEGLPSGWYATFDGYPVAQVSANHWVYGRIEREGSIVPTSVAVGSVVPMDVPELARATVSQWRSGAYDTRAFRVIAESDFDNMGVLGDPLAYTPVAWKTGEGDLLIWLGDRWYRVSPMVGESTTQALLARHPFIVRTLQEKNIVWTRSDTEELADLSREWGYVWRGTIPFASLTGYRPDGGDGGGTFAGGGSLGTGSGGSNSSGGSGGGQWDIGGDGGGSGTGGGGGGWDTGGGTGSGGSGGGWDTGTGGGSGGNNNGGTPSNGGGNSGGGWDK